MSSPYPSDLVQRVATEVEQVHHFIQAWIRGELADEDAVWAEFAVRFDPGFAMITPGGVHVGPEAALPGVRAMHGTNPDFRIWTRDCALVRVEGGTVVARYTEWQEGAKHAEAENARWTTAIFALEGASLRWLWLHETWLGH